jgi:hypothetical protein
VVLQMAPTSQSPRAPGLQLVQEVTYGLTGWDATSARSLWATGPRRSVVALATSTPVGGSNHVGPYFKNVFEPYFDEEPLQLSRIPNNGVSDGLAPGEG